MPFHWCSMESEALLMVLASLPLVGLFFKKLHAKWHKKYHTLCGHEHECKHVDTHIQDEFMTDRHNDD
jgi:hypothetical protein